MLVVITIFLIMTAVVMANFPAFRDRTALQLIAQEIATTIRQAQVYGIGTRAAGTEFQPHGIYLDLRQTNPFGLDNKSFILYADKVGSTKGYDATDQTVEKFAIRGAAEIVNLQVCSASCSDPDPKKLDILFQRFYPEAKFFDSGAELSGVSYVRIVIKSTRDPSNTRWVDIWNTGQITVKDPS